MMSAAAFFDAQKIKDIKREPRVKPRSERGEPTHTIALVPANYLHALWPDVKDQLARAVDRSKGRWSMESVFKTIIEQRSHLWVAFDEDKKINGVGTTEIVVYPGRRMLSITFLGGDKFNDWVWDMLDRFQDWARDNECSGVEATARMGFWEWLKQDGFERSYVVYEKRLDDV
jgi:hypothetical protein